jgi:hypothetical protein
MSISIYKYGNGIEIFLNIYLYTGVYRKNQRMADQESNQSKLSLSLTP